MMTDDEIIAVVQAHKEGKQIQIRMGTEWVDSWPPVWNFTYDYRVAPEPRRPREWRMGLNVYGELVPIKYKHGFEVVVQEVIDVREVIE